ncbi:hypothetical protein GYH30_048166 [Glycine max]|nr:hypothetical protein GYH30_048166 [Glycine max]
MYVICASHPLSQHADLKYISFLMKTFFLFLLVREAHM